MASSADFATNLTTRHKYVLSPFFIEFEIDLGKIVKSELKNDEQLTNQTALRIFKEIQRNSSLASFITKPIIPIVLSSLMLLAGFLIPAAGTALLAAKVLTCSIGLLMAGCSIGWHNALSDVSKAYSDLNKQTHECIQRLEKAEPNGQIFTLKNLPAAGPVVSQNGEEHRPILALLS